jgi:hypothetical protein
MPADVISKHPAGSWVEEKNELYYVAGDKKLLHIGSVNTINSEAYKPLGGKESIEMLKANGIQIKSN